MWRSGAYFSASLGAPHARDGPEQSIEHDVEIGAAGLDAPGGNSRARLSG